MTAARALMLTGPRQLELRTLPVPDTPPAGGAIIKVLRNGICGSDYDFYCGNFPLTMNLPVVPGHEIVGEIVALDPLAGRHWSVDVSTRVAVEAAVRCGECEPCRLGHLGCVNTFSYSAAPVSFGTGLWGGMAEYMVLLPGSSVYPLPPTVSLNVAGLFNVFGNATEWTARLGDVQLGDRVVVLGAGQRGIACGAIAHLRGSSEVVLTGLHRDTEKLTVASEVGATATIDVEGREVVDAVRSVLGGGLADVVIDTTPRATASIQHAVELVRPEGTIVLAGLKHAPLNGFLTDQLLMKNVTLKAALGTKPASAVAALRTLAAGRLPFERLFSMTVPLDGVERAVQVVGGEHDGEAPIHISVDPWE